MLHFIHDFTNFHELKKETSKSLFEGKSQDFKDESFENDIFPILQNDDHESSSLKDVICDMLPQVLTELEKNNVDPELLREFFFLFIIAGRYPLDNIAFLLWIETVNWYKQDTTSGMRYLDQTKTYWKLGWHHFGGRFITGFKNMAHDVNGEAEPGLLRPEESDIYFAAPAIHTARNFRPYREDISERAPGTFIDVIKETASVLEGSSASISFDGKKLKQGLTKEYGDVDLLGFEVWSSLKDRKEILAKWISQISHLKSILLSLDLTATIDAETVSKETKCIYNSTSELFRKFIGTF